MKPCLEVLEDRTAPAAITAPAVITPAQIQGAIGLYNVAASLVTNLYGQQPVTLANAFAGLEADALLLAQVSTFFAQIVPSIEYAAIASQI